MVPKGITGLRPPGLRSDLKTAGYAVAACGKGSSLGIPGYQVPEPIQLQLYFAELDNRLGVRIVRYIALYFCRNRHERRQK
jgi:hypothetical protein